MGKTIAMRHYNVARGLPMLLLLMAVAVILIIAGASDVGFAFGLVVAGIAGMLLVAMVMYEVVHTANRDRRRNERLRWGSQPPYPIR